MEKHSDETEVYTSEFESDENIRDEDDSSQAPTSNVIGLQLQSGGSAEDRPLPCERPVVKESSARIIGVIDLESSSGASEKENSEKAISVVDLEGSSGASEKTSGESMFSETDSSDLSEKLGEKNAVYLEEDAIQGRSEQIIDASESHKQTVRIRTDAGRLHIDTPPPPIMDVIESPPSTIRAEDSESLRSLERGQNVVEIKSAEATVELRSGDFVFEFFTSQLNYNFFTGLVAHLSSDFSASIIRNLDEFCKSIARYLHVHSVMPKIKPETYTKEDKIFLKYSPNELLKLLDSLEMAFRQGDFPDIANFFQFLCELFKSGKQEDEKIKAAVCELRACLYLFAEQDRCVAEINQLCRTYDVFPHEPPPEEPVSELTSLDVSAERSSDYSTKDDSKHEDSHSFKQSYESPESPPESRSSIETLSQICNKLRFSPVNYYSLYFPFIRFFLPRMNCLTNIDDILKCFLDFFLNRSLECLEIIREPALPSDWMRWEITCLDDDTLNLIDRLHTLLESKGLLRFANILSYVLSAKRANYSILPQESSIDSPGSSRRSDADSVSNHAGRLVKKKIESSLKNFPRTPSFTKISESFSESTDCFMDPGFGLEDTSWNRPVTVGGTQIRTPDILGSPEFESIEGSVIAIFLTRPRGSKTLFCRFMREYFERYQELDNMDNIFKFIANFILSTSKWKALKDESEARKLMQRQGLDKVFFWRSRDVFHLIREAETFFRGQSFTLLANFFNRLIAQEIARREGREYRYQSDYSMRYASEQAGRNVVTFISSIKMIEKLYKIYSSLDELDAKRSSPGHSLAALARESSPGSSEGTLQVSDTEQCSESNEEGNDGSSERTEDSLAVMYPQSEAIRYHAHGGLEPNEGRIGRRYYVTDYHLVPEFAVYFLHHQKSISRFSKVFKLIAEFLFHISRQYIFSIAEELKLEFFSRQDENIIIGIEYLHTFLKERGLKIFANLVEALISRYKEERAIQSAFGSPESESDRMYDVEIDFRSVSIIKKEIMNALKEFLLVGDGSKELTVLYDKYVSKVSPPETLYVQEASGPKTPEQSLTSVASEQKSGKLCSSGQATEFSLKLPSSITEGPLLKSLAEHLNTADIDGTNLDQVLQAVADFFYYKMGHDVSGGSDAAMLQATPGCSRTIIVTTPISNFNFIFVVENFLRNNNFHLASTVLLLLMEYFRVNETFFDKVKRASTETLLSQATIDPVEWRYFLLQCINTKIEILNMESRSETTTESRTSYKVPYKKRSKQDTDDHLKDSEGQPSTLKTKAALKLYETGVESELKRIRLSEAATEEVTPDMTTELTVGELVKVVDSRREELAEAFKKSAYAELEELEKSERSKLAQNEPVLSPQEVESPDPEPSTSFATESIECIPETSREDGRLPQRRDRKRSQPQSEGESKPSEQKVSRVSPKKSCKVTPKKSRSRRGSK